jgi:long-chain acyl-CoA synthetase
MKKSIADSAVETKLTNVRESATVTHCFYDALVFNKVKNVFGGQVRLMATGSAPLDGAVLEFMKIAACAPLIEGYGQTESTAASFISSGVDPAVGHVGGPTAPTEFKLVDIPDMNYRSTDKNEHGQPTPRGEICFRGPMVIPGYYKDPEKTAEAIDKDGWLHSGDVGMLQPNLSLKIIDRKKNIFKLQHGEYIAPEKIENILILSQYIQEAFVYGDSLKNHLVGVCFPKEAGLKALAASIGIQDQNLTTLCENPQLKTALLKELDKHCRASKLYGFEVLKQIHLVPTSLIILGLCTPSFKLKRNDAKIYFKKELDYLYSLPVAEGK